MHSVTIIESSYKIVWVQCTIAGRRKHEEMHKCKLFRESYFKYYTRKISNEEWITWCFGIPFSWGNGFNFIASLHWVQSKLSLSALYRVKVSNRVEDIVVVLSCVVSAGLVALISRIFLCLFQALSSWNFLLTYQCKQILSSLFTASS